MDNLLIRYNSDEQNGIAIYVHGNHHSFKKIDIETNGYGIYLNDAHENVMDGVRITGTRLSH